MVPLAQARGIRRVRILGGGDVNRAPLETIAYRRVKVEWLRSLLGATAFTPVAPDRAPSLAGIDTLTFGVELEVVMPMGWDRERVALEINSAGVMCVAEMYGHSTPRNWKVITDNSLGYARGAEVVSPPIRGEEGFRQLRVVCETLTRIGCKITSKCGFHVHVGCRDAQADFFKNLIVLYSTAERAIDQFMPDSRKGSSNNFCKPVVLHSRSRLREARTVGEIASTIGQRSDRGRHSSRYCKLNLEAYFAYGTVEFRHHGGTVDATKAQNWVRLCLRMVLTAKAGEREVSTVEELLSAVDATEAERIYFRSRVAYFNRGRIQEQPAPRPSPVAVPAADRVVYTQTVLNTFESYGDRAIEHARGPARRSTFRID